MVEAKLNEQLIKAGAELVQRLDDKGLSPDAAFWLYSSEAQAWRLFLTEATLGKEGPKDVYRKIQNIMKGFPKNTQVLRLSDIGLVSPDSPFIEQLRKAIKTDHGISGIRFTNNVIDGNLIEDAYIYRVA